MSIRATYRLQFHQGFTFADAEAILPYLARLGISHVYASPITTAQPGSMHGYDVADPTRINPELGGEPAFRALVAALRRHDMGLVLDIVPNHMGVAAGTNGWWNDVLEKGPDSPYARYFDIDWSEKLLLPFLGEPLDAALASGALTLRETEGRAELLAYDSRPYPIRPEDQARLRSEGIAPHDPATRAGRARLARLLDRQHYRLAWWRTANDCLNWRRFFTITELAGLRIEDDSVFEAAHAFYFQLYAEGLVDGLRIDHVDGLADPAAYCRKLRARLEGLRADRRPWIVVEKILATGEALPADWAVDGTSGYDFMEAVTALLHAPEAEEPLTCHWARLSGRPGRFREEELNARRDMLAWEFEGQLAACVRAFAALARSAADTRELTGGMLRRAIERLLWVFPAYRTYGTGRDAPDSDARIRDAALEAARSLAAPGEAFVLETVLAWLAGHGPGDPALAAEAVRRFQQLSAPIAAKAVEDTAFYRHGRLLSRTDVGFDPGRFSMPIADFHAAMACRRADFPRALLGTATHDHKRGEDVRARLAALSEAPAEWIERTERWMAAQQDLHPADLYQLCQTLYGSWPPELAPDDAAGLADLAARIAAWQEKALREAKLRSSWTEPDTGYEARARQCVEALLDPARSASFLADMHGFVRTMAPAAQANGLAQTLLRCTVPGVPDLYQGTEYADLSLVDPDNRRPVDFAARAATFTSGGTSYDARKQELIARLLRLRRAAPALFAEGSYEPLSVEGPRAGHVLAFARRHDGAVLVAAVALRCGLALSRARDALAWWAGTRLVPPPWLGEEQWTDAIDGTALPSLPGDAAALFAAAPIRLFHQDPSASPPA